MKIVISILIIFNVFFMFFLGVMFMENKQIINKFYSLREYTSNNIIRTYQEKKEFEIKKGLIVFKNAQCKWQIEKQLEILNLAFELSEQYHVSYELYLATGYNESRFNNNAIGPANEITYLQFMRGRWETAISGYWYQDCEKDLSFVTKIWFRYMSNIIKDLCLISQENIDERTFLAYNCGHEIFRYIITKDEIDSLKQLCYISKGRIPYSDNIRTRIEWIRTL